MESISSSAARIVSTFFLIIPEDQCPQTISHARILTLINTNPALPDTPFDSLLHIDLILNNVPCIGTPTAATFFIDRTPSSADIPVAQANPWFLEGRDNAQRQCPPFLAPFPASYFFTDDLPRFRQRFVDTGFLPADLPPPVDLAVQGQVFMFARQFPPNETDPSNTPPLCVYISESVSTALPSQTPPSVPSLSSSPISSPIISPISAPPASTSASAQNPEPIPSPLDSLSTTEEPLPNPPEDSGESVCFPASAVVHLESGHALPMSKLRPGHVVQVGENTFSPVVSFSHRDGTSRHTFRQLLVSRPGVNDSLLTITGGHFLYIIDGRRLPAAHIFPGHVLKSPKGPAHVIAAYWGTATGLYSPVTAHGDIVVDGVVTSCYTTSVKVPTAHALLLPVRASFWLSSRFGLRVLDVCSLVDLLRWGLK